MSSNKEPDTDFLIQKKGPKHKFCLKDCGFLNSNNTKQIGLYNKNILEQCLISVIMDKDDDGCDHIDSESIYGKWNYLLITLFGLRFTVKREKYNKNEKLPRNLPQDNTKKFIVKCIKEDSTTFDKNIKSVDLQKYIIKFDINRIYSEKKPNKKIYKNISKFDTSSKYMSITNKQISFYEQITATKNPEQTEQNKKDIFPLERISCKTAILYIISLAYRLKMQELLDRASELTLTDNGNIFIKSWKFTKSTFSKFTNYLKKFPAKIRTNLLTKKKDPNKLIKELLNFKVRYLSEMPIDVDNAYATKKVWDEIKETFYLNDCINELDSKQRDLIDYQRNKFQESISSKGVIIAIFAIFLTGISACNDGYELLDKPAFLWLGITIFTLSFFIFFLFLIKKK